MNLGVNAIKIWVEGDELMFRKIDTANKMHGVISTQKQGSRQKEVTRLLLQISDINDQLTEVENRFSYTLGEASRWLEHLLMIVLVIAVATIECIGLILTITFSRGLARSIKELHAFAFSL